MTPLVGEDSRNALRVGVAMAITGKAPSEVTGIQGNREIFVHLQPEQA